MCQKRQSENGENYAGWTLKGPDSTSKQSTGQLAHPLRRIHTCGHKLAHEGYRDVSKRRTHGLRGGSVVTDVPPTPRFIVAMTVDFNKMGRAVRLSNWSSTRYLFPTSIRKCFIN